MYLNEENGEMVKVSHGAQMVEKQKKVENLQTMAFPAGRSQIPLQAGDEKAPQ